MQKLIKITVYSIMLVFFTSCFSSKGIDIKKSSGNLSDTVSTSVMDHSDWDAMLKKYVDDEGFVNYKGVKNDLNQLDAYLDYLAANKPAASWSLEDQLAYFINLYNAATLQLVASNYPVKSIKDIGSVTGPFLISFIKIGDEEMSLANLEKGILQKMGDPRIHFAINCASYSCPKLMNKAYTAQNVNKLMDQAAKDFINSDKNQITESAVKLSKIFDWYKSDFTDTGVTLVEYVNTYSNTAIKKGQNLDYLEYDWSLNEKK